VRMSGCRQKEKRSLWTMESLKIELRSTGI
jgi:hypothetical protein